MTTAPHGMAAALHYEVVATHANNVPTLVMLHGFLGNTQDWRALLPFMSAKLNVILIDLPGHGASASLQVSDFDECMRLICHTLTQAIVAHSLNQRCWFFGYSLGGRLAMYLATHSQPLARAFHLEGIVIESSHVGLPSAARAERWQQDLAWAQRFASEPLAAVLTDWYQQPVFADLTAAQRQQLITKRSINKGKALAAMLTATSLARQPQLQAKLRAMVDRKQLQVLYLYGDQDVKFAAIAKQSGFDCIAIANAGHNTHIVAPKDVANSVLDKILS